MSEKNEFPTTQEDRIKAQYRSLRKQILDGSGDYRGLWMTLAETWHMPIADIKQIVGFKKYKGVPETWRIHYERRDDLKQLGVDCELVSDRYEDWHGDSYDDLSGWIKLSPQAVDALIERLTS